MTYIKIKKRNFRKRKSHIEYRYEKYFNEPMLGSKNKSLLFYYGFTKKDQKKYPIITNILKKLTSKRIEKEIREFKKVILSIEIQKWVKEYEKVASRDVFLWKWMYRMFEILYLPFVPSSRELKLKNIKVLFTMFITLLDDVADGSKNQVLLKILLEIPFQKEKFNLNNINLDSEEKKIFELSLKLWNRILYLIKRDLVNYKEYEEIFKFDLFQALNEMRYAYLFNKYPCLINKNEYWTFLPYNMCLYVYCDMDLMSYSKFNINKFGILREIIWDIQKTSRIANWLVTWQRELKEKDFSSIVFAYYTKRKSLKKIDKKDYSRVIREIEKQEIEKQIFIEWERSYLKIKTMSKNNKNFKIDKILKILEDVLFLHIASSDHI